MHLWSFRASRSRPASERIASHQLFAQSCPHEQMASLATVEPWKRLAIMTGTVTISKCSTTAEPCMIGRSTHSNSIASSRLSECGACNVVPDAFATQDLSSVSHRVYHFTGDLARWSDTSMLHSEQKTKSRKMTIFGRSADGEDGSADDDPAFLPPRILMMVRRRSPRTQNAG